jgi:hypothetical protein
LTPTANSERQGVACDYCHRIAQIEIDGDRVHITHVNTDTGQAAIKYGPFSDANSPFHATARLDQMETSLICAACHQYMLPNGVTVDNTYRQWSSGPFNGEPLVPCQGCHMASRPGRASNHPNSPMRKAIHSHAFRGGDSQSQFSRALKIELVQMDDHVVEAVAINSGTGHNVPGSRHGFRRLELTISATDLAGRNVFERSMVYSLSFVDNLGNPTIRFWNAVAVAKDSSIPPGGAGRERFEVPNNSAAVRVFLLYRRMPDEIVENLGWAGQEQYQPAVVASAELRVTR